MTEPGRVALVTGGSGGIGQATAAALAAAGHRVAVGYSANREAAEKAAAELDGMAVQIDVTEPAGVDAAFTEVEQSLGPVDVLVNNAGITADNLLARMSLEDWERVLRINLTGSFLTAQAAARHMVEQGGGRIIQIGSISGQRGNMGGIAYGASKAAVMHVCKVLAVELSGQGVMVNAIAPGPIETGLSKHGPTRRQGYLDRIPTHSYGNVDAVANAALYLASDECDWVTGHILNVDGGYGAAGLSYDPTEIR